MNSANKWKAHTSTTEFATAFNKITNDYAHDNELRTHMIESFLINEAKKAEVIKSTRNRVQKNTNRW